MTAWPHRRRTLLILVLTFLGMLTALFAVRVGPRLAVAAEASWKIVVDGKPSRMAVVEAERGSFLPLSFPLEKGEVTWEVQLKTDPAGRTVQVTRTCKRAGRQRADEACSFCYGDGKCRACYPIGSGKNTDDNACVPCNGTGVCQPCKGTGKR